MRAWSQQRWVRATASLMVGVVILAALIAVVHPDEIARSLRGASLGWIAASLLGLCAFFVVRGWRWKIILHPSAPRVSVADATAVTTIGWAINSVSPFKLGDVVRAASMAQRARIGVGASAATVVLERTLDVLALLLLAIVAAAVSGSRGGGSWGRLIILSLLAVGVATIGYWLIHDEARTIRLVSALAQPLPAKARTWLIELVPSVLRGFHLLRSRSQLLAAILLSLAQWALSAGTLFALFRAVSPQLSTSTLLLALILFTITQAISVTPGGLGTYEFLFVVTLGAFGGSPPALLTAIAVLTHVVGTAFFLACGALGVLWLRFVQPPGGSLPARPAEVAQ
jgi:uncharacterized protein (TIRG00374 family)